jgi:hypothetical protein
MGSAADSVSYEPSRYAQALGDGTAQAEIPYLDLDAADDDRPGALQPKLRYEFLAGKVSVRIRLTSGNTTVADQVVSASSNDPQALAKMLATKIVAMAVEKDSTRLFAV